MSVRDTYPLPRMDEYIRSLCEAHILTTFDVSWGYWKMPAAERDQEKTALACHAGLLGFRRMLFGLSNTTSTFQRGLGIILARYKWKTFPGYFDDGTVFSKTVEAHIENVDTILSSLRNAGISVWLRKEELFSKRGQLAESPHQTRETGNGTGPTSSGTKPPTTWNSNPTTSLTRLVQRVMHVRPTVLAYRSAIECHPQKRSTRETRGIWGSEMAVFETIKAILMSYPVMALPNLVL